jgi:hypothetical protein
MEEAMNKDTQEFYRKYYGALEGATVLKFEGMIEDDFDLNPFPRFSIRLKSGEIATIEVSADEEGNGGGFLFGLDAPTEVQL